MKIMHWRGRTLCRITKKGQYTVVLAFKNLVLPQLMDGKTSSAGQIRTDDLEVMSLASYRAAPPRVISRYYTHLGFVG